MSKTTVLKIAVSLLSTILMPLGAFADVPEGYMPVDYIEKNGAQYIDSGVKPSGSTTLEMKLWTPVLERNCYMYGALKAWQDCSFATYVSKNSGSLNVVVGRSYFGGLKYNANRVCIVRHEPTALSCNGTRLKSWAAEEFETPVNLLLLAMQTPNGVSKHDMAADGTRLYYAKIWDGDTLIRDLVPVVRAADGVPGLYDLAEGGFYSSANVEEEGFRAGFENIVHVDVTNMDRPKPSVALQASAVGAEMFSWTRRGISSGFETIAETG